MDAKKQFPKRKSIRIKGYDYSQVNAYYITVCVDDRKCLFGCVEGCEMKTNEYGSIVKEEILKNGQIRKNVEIVECVVMPNHFYAIFFIKDGRNMRVKNALPGKIRQYIPEEAPAVLMAGSIGAIVGQIKSKSTKRIRAAGLQTFEWQRNYYEHIVRDEDDLAGIREYIINNPAKWAEDEYNPDKKC